VSLPLATRTIFRYNFEQKKGAPREERLLSILLSAYLVIVIEMLPLDAA